MNTIGAQAITTEHSLVFSISHTYMKAQSNSPDNTGGAVITH